MGITPAVFQSDVRRERHVARDLFPNEMKRVLGKPHVRPTACDCVCVPVGRNLDGTRALWSADVTIAFKQAEFRGVQLQRERQRQDHREASHRISSEGIDSHQSPVANDQAIERSR